MSKERFSLYLELNVALYVGVVAFVFGLGWTFQTYFTNLGDPFILTTCSVMVAGCLGYCFRRGTPYSHGEVASPSLGFDYVLYLGCLVLSAELAYIEFRFHLFRGTWDYYLLFTAATFALLAYRFDNRFVLSLGLASLAGWFGLQVSALRLMTPNALRLSALVYGAIVAGAGTALFRQRIKPHFLETYLHLAANVVFSALLSGVSDRQWGGLYLAALAAVAGTAIALGIRFSRFAYVAYGIVYLYLGISSKVLANTRNATAACGYFVVTGTLVILALVMLARRFGREE